MCCAAILGPAAATLLGLLPPSYLLPGYGLKMMEGYSKKAVLGSEMRILSLVSFHPKVKVNNACACVQEVAPAA